jgi:hypothetical protein
VEQTLLSDMYSTWLYQDREKLQAYACETKKFYASRLEFSENMA